MHETAVLRNLETKRFLDAKNQLISSARLLPALRRQREEYTQKQSEPRYAPLDLPAGWDPSTWTTNSRASLTSVRFSPTTLVARHTYDALAVALTLSWDSDVPDTSAVDTWRRKQRTRVFLSRGPRVHAPRRRRHARERSQRPGVSAFVVSAEGLASVFPVGGSEPLTFSFPILSRSPRVSPAFVPEVRS